MTLSPSRYADWKAPADDGQILIWPAVADLIAKTRENATRFAHSEALIQNVPLSHLRRKLREWIGHRDQQRPIIASGHQAQLYHPGVWVKDVLANAVARHMDGEAYHFAVDTDAPRHLHLRWPGGSFPISDDEQLSRAAWSGLLDGPTPAHLKRVKETFYEGCLGWDFEPMAEKFLESMAPMAMEGLPLSAQLTDALHRLDWGLGMRHHAMLVSPIWGSEQFLVFAHHLLARAGEFAAQYNSALSQYRHEQGIIATGRPMPDLHVEPDRVEAPFWLDDLVTGTRRRLEVTRTGDGWAIEGFVFWAHREGQDASRQFLSFLRQRQWRIAPRALTLTMFLRLAVADQFVHGIGGGRYDQVTDRIIHSHFGIEPPAFCVTTGTLYFPGARGQMRINLRPLIQEGRRLRHGSFSKEKREMAGRIATLPRRSTERRNLFYQMHGKLAQQASSPRMREWAQRLEEATREQVRQKTLFDRELFFAIQPEDRLREMVARYDGAISGQSGGGGQ